MMVRGPEPKQVEDSRVVHLHPRREPAEFPGELHEGEVSPAKGKDAGGELHHLGGRGWVVLRSSILSRMYGGARNEEMMNFF